MINILIPVAGKSIFFEENDFRYPKPLIEIASIPMIKWVVDNLNSIKQKKNFIFIVNKQDCSKFHLDNVLNLLTNNECQIIKLANDTKGAACSCLIAGEYINNDNPLLIVNGDQIIDVDLNDVLEFFQNKKSDAGVITFDSVHPKWSFVRIDDHSKIVETAEKRPVSKNAIAGFYYFAKGKFFITSAMNSIRKDSNVEGQYFIAPVLNEMVLSHMNLDIYPIAVDKYHNFYSPHRITEFEKRLEKVK